MKWTREEIKFLKENYSLKGISYCIKHLKRNYNSISWKVKSLKLRKVFNKNLDINIFLNIQNPNVIYLLGLIWADGTVYKSQVTLECVLEDADIFELYVKEICNYKFYIRNRGHRTQKSLNINSVELFNFLNSQDYDKKSTYSPNKILSKIPENLKHYFFRGISDGDGCFYFNKKGYLKQFSISGHYEQDWSYLINIFNKLGVKKYNIQNHYNNKGKGSLIRVTNKNDIKIIGSYIYQNYSTDNIGLPRKYNKFLEIIN